MKFAPLAFFVSSVLFKTKDYKNCKCFGFYHSPFSPIFLKYSYFPTLCCKVYLWSKSAFFFTFYSLKHTSISGEEMGGNFSHKRKLAIQIRIQTKLKMTIEIQFSITFLSYSKPKPNKSEEIDNFKFLIDNR